MRFARGVFLLLWKGEGNLKIIRKINNNAAVAQDKQGREMVVLGKGIGFRAVPYELTDLSSIYRTYYDVNPKYFGLAGELPTQVILAATEIAEKAEFTLGCQLNPNLPFTLADHLNFAIERKEKKIELANPLGYDVKHIYPKEYHLGEQALNSVEQHTGCRLPDAEAVSIALHLVNGELEASNLGDMVRTLDIIAQIGRMVEQQLQIHLDRESYNYSRFAMHLQYLIKRLETGKQSLEMNTDMLEEIAREYPDIYKCAVSVGDFLHREYHWDCNREETLYLMMHINRVGQRSS